MNNWEQETIRIKNCLIAKKLISEGKGTKKDFQKAGLPRTIFSEPCIWEDCIEEIHIGFAEKFEKMFIGTKVLRLGR